MKLTLENYFTPENKYLSNSKIGDYLKSPNYFYRKHILHEIEQKTSNALVLGSGVDYLLAQNDNKPEYRVVERRNLKNPPEGYIELNQAQYDEIFEIADAVANNDVFKDIDKTFAKQLLLTMDMPLGNFVGLCGLPDYILVKDNEIIIVDLKTSRTTDPRKYYWHCKEFGYFRQQAFYQHLAIDKYGLKRVSSYHLVVEKTKDIYDVKFFKIDQKEIDREARVLQKAIDEIKERTDWSRPNLKWSNAIKLSNPGESFEESVGEEEE